MSVTPEQPETQKPRTLFSGIMKVLSGVDDIQDALKRWRLWFVAIGMCAAIGGVADRSQGFPMAHWAAKGLIPEKSNNNDQLVRMERKQDSTTAIILARVDSVADAVEDVKDSLGAVSRRLTKTQIVLAEVARRTKTDKPILRDQERARGLFDWGAR